MTRRDFLILPLPALLGLLACFGSPSLRTALAGFFEDRKSAVSVGNEYLRLHPAEDDDTQPFVGGLKAGRGERAGLARRPIIPP